MVLMKILLIDDNPIDLLLNERVVRSVKPEAEIIKFKSGVEALEYFTTIDEEIDLIFLDIKMPLMDGFQLLKEMERLGSANFKATYMVSSSIDPIDIKRSKKSKLVKGFIEKPLSLQKLDPYLTH